jgi:hypothetical protein
LLLLLKYLFSDFLFFWKNLIIILNLGEVFKIYRKIWLQNAKSVILIISIWDSKTNFKIRLISVLNEPCRWIWNLDMVNSFQFFDSPVMSDHNFPTGCCVCSRYKKESLKKYLTSTDSTMIFLLLEVFDGFFLLHPMSRKVEFVKSVD